MRKKGRMSRGWYDDMDQGGKGKRGDGEGSEKKESEKGGAPFSPRGGSCVGARLMKLSVEDVYR